MAELTIDGETFRVEVEGDQARPPLMLSNALGTNLSMWDEQVPALTKNFRVIRYDTRGHGGSTLGDPPVSMARLGADALAILDALGIDKMHWLGLSMGGAIGLWLLINAPQRIDRAILANTAPKLGNPEGWNARITSVLAPGMGNNGMADNAAATIERWFSPAFAARAPDRVGAIQAMLRATTPRGYAACCAALRDMDLREGLAAIGRDVLIINGRRDPVVPAADAAKFVEGIAGAKHVALDARHMSNIEADAAFNAAIIGFLTARRTARAAPNRAKNGSAEAGSGKRNTAKTAPPKRGGAARRSNAARSPLKKTPPKRTAAGRPAKAAGSGGRRAATKAGTARRGTPKTVAKKPAVKARPKAGSTRRLTPTTAARGMVKKTKPRKAALKSSAKKAATKSAAKKLPAARRRPAKKPRRPSGRRKT